MTKKFGVAAALSTAVFAAGTLVLLGPILTGRAVLSDSDILIFHFPVETAIREMFLRGQGLLWSPLLGEGQPLAANPHNQIFYPFTWLIFLLPVASALAITQVAHLALTWFGMRRLLRRLGASEISGLVASATWTFGGAVISSMHLLPTFYAWTWMPWLLSEVVSETPSIPRLALFGALIGVIGEPSSFVMAVLLAVPVFFFRRPTARRFRSITVGALLSLLLSAATWLPGFALARKGPRGTGFAAETAGQLSFPPLRLIELIVPRATGNTVPHRDSEYFGWRLYPEKRWPFFTGIYGGTFLVPLLIVGLFERSRRMTVFLAPLVLSLLLSLGGRGVLWNLLRETFPPWRSIRYPEKFLAVALFAAAIIAAFGLDFVRRSPRRGLVTAAAMTLSGSAFGLLSVFDVGWLSARFPVENATRVYRFALMRSAAVFLILGVLLALMALSRRLRAPALLGLLVVAAVDVLGSSRDFVRFHSVAEMTASPPVIRRILRGGVSRLVDMLPENPPVPVPGAEVFNGPWDRNRISGEQAIQWGVPLALDADFDLTYIAESDRARALMSRIAVESPAHFARLLAGRADGALLLWNRPITLADPVTVAAVPNTRPEIDSVSEVISFKGDEDFLERVRSYPGDLSRVAFVEGRSAFPRTGAPATIAIKTRRNSRIEFTSDGNSASVVRIARTNDGNWRAFVDGARWPVETVDLSLIGMRIPAGRHEIVVLYRDYWLTAGMLVSAVGVAVLCFIAIRGIRRPLALSTKRADG